MPVVGDIASSMQGMLAELKQNTFTTPLVWRDILNIHKQQNAQKMHEKLSTDTQPLNYFNALSAMRDVLRENQDIYLVNEGANTWIMHEILLICINHVAVWIVVPGCHGHRYGLCHRC